MRQSRTDMAMTKYQGNMEALRSVGCSGVELPNPLDVVQAVASCIQYFDKRTRMLIAELLYPGHPHERDPSVDDMRDVVLLAMHLYQAPYLARLKQILTPKQAHEAFRQNFFADGSSIPQVLPHGVFLNYNTLKKKPVGTGSGTGSKPVPRRGGRARRK